MKKMRKDMNIWYWLLTICGSLLVLIILLGILARMWLRKHPELLVQGQDDGVAIPPDFETDFRRAQQLEEQRQRDPRAILPLIQVYKRMLERLRSNEGPLLYAGIQHNLGAAYRDLPTGDRASNLVQAIGCYQQALRFRTPEAAPLDYAMTQNNLGLAYSELPTGDRATNLERAIGCFEEALRFYTPEAAPLEYALTQNNLGLAYYKMPTGDRAANLAQAIACYQQAQRFLTPEAAPLEYATTQNSLGLAYSELPTGDRAANLAQAIACYQQAQRFRTPEAAPLDYAMTQHNLGLAYTDLPTGDRAANLARAIGCFEEALRFYTPEAAPLDYAMTQNNLGGAYYQLPTGDRATNLERAIGCFEEALRFRTPEAVPLMYALTQNSLGNAYGDLPTGNRAANLAQAIGCYQQALRFWTPEAAPLDYAMTQHNLGGAYSKLPTGDRAANLAQAIACYQEALRFLTPEAAPREYAMTQNSLGTAYRNLPAGDRAANLAQAIGCYQQALRFRTPEAAPLDYAMTQHNLGNAYRDLPTGDRAANLAQAIGCYQQALRFRTPEAAPLDYAMTQNSLGNAYRDLPTGDRAANLVQAIQCYQLALRFYTPEAAPLDYALTQNNLGLAYYKMPTGDRATNLERAIGCFEEALRFRTLEAAPLQYALTQNNLGAAYSQLPTGDRAANLVQAIQCYQLALRFYTPEAAPLDYAMTQNNLGAAYRNLPIGNRAANLTQAIGCYQEALRFYTPEAEPFLCRGITLNLADLYFAQGAWDAALRTYREAIDVGEQLYRVGLSTTSKVAEVFESTALYPHAAFTAVRCGETAEALLILERGKTRLLTEALRLRVRRPPHVPDEMWSAFEQAGTAVRAEQAEKPPMAAEVRNPVQAYEAHVQAARAASAALDAAIAHIRTYAPHFLEAIDLSTIEAQLSDQQTALLAFCITEQGSMGFVVSRHHQGAIQVVEMPTFTQTDVHRLFVEWDADGQPSGGWLGAYSRYLIDDTVTAFEAWQGTLTRVLAELGERLLTPLVSALSADIERLILLPSAELFLFPLHAVPLSSHASELLCDRYQVSYTPSIEVLADARAKVKQGVTPELYAVINPGDDPKLIFTPIEGGAIARLFAQPTLDAGRAGTKKRVLAGVQGRTYVHFSCHGSYDWNDPPASGLELADDRLTLAELQQGEVDLSAARLVTLSACETGISDVLQGSAEEYVGIPAGFLLAGAPCVVSSLWAVPDLSTTLLMERFYHNHLVDTMDFAAALQESQAWVRELRIGEVAAYAALCYRQSPQKEEEKKELLKWKKYYLFLAQQHPDQRPFAHPFYWAAFTVNGL
jgi:CHAT domain-containing protein/tetratricopeptide (TPR) repeat protein